MNWQPIETYTDSDGMVLVYDIGAMRVAWREGGVWVQPAIPVMLNECDDHVRDIGRGRRLVLSDCLYNPTHWMPLPEPPESAE